MLNILFDYQHFSEQKYGGISRYFAGLVNAIDQRDDVAYKLSTLYTRNYHIKDHQVLLNNNLGDAMLNKKREIWLNQNYSKLMLHINDHDIFHPTYYHPYFLYHVKKPFVITVHDMIHERFPGSFLPNDPVAKYKKETIEQADRIIAVSEATKLDLIKILNVSEEKIRVIHHGITTDIEKKRSAPKFDLPGEYILYVGDRSKYKNFDRFAEAMALVMPQHKNLYLICAGGAKFSDAEAKHLQGLNIIHKCIRLNVTDAGLKQLYDNARLLVSPSLCEGFGYPLLEAFNAGCPIAASSIASTVEVAGDAVKYFDPYQTDSLYEAITVVLNNEDLRDELINKGYGRVKAFPLGREINETINCYKELVK